MTLPGSPAADASLAALLSIASDPIITIDDRYRIVQFNRGAEEVFGYAASVAVGQPLEILIPERFRVAHRGHVTDFAAAAHAARRMGERQEIWALRRDGREFPAEASISRVDTPNGRLYTVVLRDVTDRHRAARAQRLLAAAGTALARSLEWEETARAAAGSGVPTFADAAVVVLGAPVRAAAGSVHSDPDVRSVLDALAAEATTTHAALWRDDAGEGPANDRPTLVDGDVAAWVRRRGASGAVRALVAALRPRALLIVPILARDERIGELTLLALSVEQDRRSGDPAAARHSGRVLRPAFEADDIELAATLGARIALAAVKAQFYDDARSAVRARDEVLAVVAHDLRNPLGAVGALARALYDGVAAGTMGRDEQLDVLRSVTDATAMADRLIRDLLDVARIDAGQFGVDRRRIEAAEVVARVVALFGAPAAARHVSLDAEVAPALPPLHADAARLVQALANLVDNALRHTPPGGRVRVRAAIAPATGEGAPVVAFIVADSGIGVPPDDLPHLFDATWHAHRRARGAGSGLGLRIARGIAVAHGGTLQAASDLGQGATFTLALPGIA